MALAPRARPFCAPPRSPQARLYSIFYREAYVTWMDRYQVRKDFFLGESLPAMSLTNFHNFFLLSSVDRVRGAANILLACG